MVIANFSKGERSATARGLWQYDYGQVLRIQGLQLPDQVQIHFATQEAGGAAIVRLGTTQDGVTDVSIPDSILTNGDTACNYEVSGGTMKMLLDIAQQNADGKQDDLNILPILQQNYSPTRSMSGRKWQPLH